MNYKLYFCLAFSLIVNFCFAAESAKEFFLEFQKAVKEDDREKVVNMM